MLAPKPRIRFLFLGDPKTDRRLKNFAHFFRQHDHEVEIVFATPGANRADIHSIGDIFARQLPLKHRGGRKMFMEYDSLLADELKKATSTEILFACDLYSLRAAAHSRSAGKVGQLYYDARELYTELPSVADNPLKKWYWRRWESYGLKRTDLVIVTAPDDANAIRTIHNFLPPSIVIRNFPGKEELKQSTYLRDRFTIPLKKKIFVYIGGLQQDRGLDLILDLMPQLSNEAAFVIIGDGLLKGKLEEKVNTNKLEESVFFHPSIESEKVIGVLASADIGVSLIEPHSGSYQLALPSKIFEYMLAGLPVISSPLKQVFDLLKDKEGILFADPQIPADLLKACRLAIAMAGEVELRTRLYVDAYNNFTFEAESEKLMFQQRSSSQTIGKSA
ncbi:MAG: glycosyltransferase [Bacteroidota bacterium]|nr:glycosyltransferase [Bacteroidota bacterium]MDP4229305.1 glycosyltransferase [Bacteroidota bacterium]